MSNEIEMSGFVTAIQEVRTVEDLRTLVGWLNKYSVPNSAEVDWGTGKVYVELTGRDAIPAEWIECGDHMPPSRGYDIIIPTHVHADETAPKRPAKFDWPMIDRYGQEERPE
jgi:hypothetical protein